MMFMCTPLLPSWLMAHPALKTSKVHRFLYQRVRITDWLSAAEQSRALASPATAPDHPWTRASGPAGPDVAGLGVGWKH